jgi:UPF0716 family protein affecting phage T7 exclusion
VVLYAVAFLLIKPGLITDMIGFALFVVIAVRQWFSYKRQPALAQAKPSEPLNCAEKPMQY